MKRRILSILMVIVMVITMFPVYSIPTSALTSGEFEYEVISEDEKTAAITDYTRYNNSVTEVEIPTTIDGYTITTIGEYAFYYCTSLTSIIIPDSVTEIDQNAFTGCSSLTSIIIPEGVTSIGDWAFSSCDKLTSVEIPASVTSIGDWAFDGCSSLTSIIVDAKNQCYSSDEQGVLFNKDKTTLIQYPIGNERINYLVPDGVTLIAERAFCGCDYLKYVAFPSTITSIGDWAFSSCSALTHVSYAGTETDWGKVLIGTGNTNLADATLHYEIDNSAVLYEKNSEETCTTTGTGTYKCAVCDATLHVVNFPSLGHNFENNNCTWCELPLFAYELDSNNDAVITRYNGTDTCVFVPSTVDGYTVKTIKITSSTVKIKSVTIPKTVTLIESLPYSSLTEIIVDKDNKVYCSIDGVLFNKDATTLVMYPDERTDESYVIPEGVTTIGMGAFANGRNLRWVEFPSTLKTIEEQAFIDSYIQRAVLPEGLETIGYAAFFDCELLQSLCLPNTLTSIGDYSFAMSDYLEVVNLPDSLESIGESAFAYSQRLHTVYFGKNLKTIGNNAFAYCYALTSVEIPASVTTIGEGAFLYCISLTNIKVDNNNEAYCSIDGVLFNKDTTTLIVYPAGKEANEYSVPQTVKNIDAYAFVYNQKLISLEIPEGIISIGEYAFVSCEALKIISLPSTLTQIDNYVFNGCNALNHVLYAGTETDWSSIGDGNTHFANSTLHYEVDMTAIDKVETVEPTCTQGGTATCICTICDSEICSLSSLTALGHNMVNNVCTRCETKEFSYSLDESGNAIITGYFGSNTDVIVPSTLDGYTVTTIGAEAFLENINITNVTLPNTLTTIGDVAFAMSGLKNITIPKSVISIGLGAFAICPYLKAITVEENNVAYCSVDGVLFDENVTTIFAYPSGKTSLEYTVPSTVTSICTYAFCYCESLTKITIPNSVAMITEYAIFECSALTEIHYKGTKCQWERVAIGDDFLSSAKITYTGDHVFGDFEFITNAGIGETCTIQKVCSLCSEVEKINFILGDVNEDSIVDTRDYNMIVQATTCTTTLTYEQILVADINGDGAVDGLDAICLDLALNGLLDNADVINMRTIALVPKQDDENE